jgi:hypothetical protein
MRQLAAQVADHRALLVVVAAAPRGRPSRARRACAVRADHQPRLQPAPVLDTELGALAIQRQAGEARAVQQPDVVQASRRCAARAAPARSRRCARAPAPPRRPRRTQLARAAGRDRAVPDAHAGIGADPAGRDLRPGATGARMRRLASDSAETRSPMSDHRRQRGGASASSTTIAVSGRPPRQQRRERRADHAGADDRDVRSRLMDTKGRPSASRGKRPARPMPRRRARRAPAERGRGRPARAGGPRAGPNSLVNSCTSPSVSRTVRARSASRHSAYSSSNAVEPGSPPGQGATSSASAAASRRPRLKPWPATGWMPCAALPASTTRPACQASRLHQRKGRPRAAPALRNSPSRKPNAACSAARNPCRPAPAPPRPVPAAASRRWSRGPASAAARPAARSA